MNIDSIKATWSSWSLKKKVIVVVIALAVIGGLTSKKENPSTTTSTSTADAPAAAPVAAPSEPVSSGGSNKAINVKALVDHFGPSGWAKCISGQVAISAMIVRGDPGVQQLKEPNDHVGDVLGAMRQNMLANNIPQQQLDQLIRGWSSQIRSGDQAYQIVNQCISEMIPLGVAF